ncbi:UNVERIFIED_CONTAM: hypothetical protein GTU68_065197 [Idotea baltica]|nr:hypothetical protein [Idotea baltica]
MLNAWGAGAPVVLLLELAGNAARTTRNLRIIPRHLQLAYRNDEEI